MSEAAPRRSIDEIIGSIRSIVGNDHANDAGGVPSDLTDVPPAAIAPRATGRRVEPVPPDAPHREWDDGDRSPRDPFATDSFADDPYGETAYAEPVARRRVAGDMALPDRDAPGEEPDERDRQRLAEIARTVSEHMVEPVADAPRGSDAGLTPDAAMALARAEVRTPAPREPGSFGRRGLPPEEGLDAPIHERLQALTRAVASERAASEHTVAMRGVTVQAANDALPGDAEATGAGTTAAEVLAAAHAVSRAAAHLDAETEPPAGAFAPPAAPAAFAPAAFSPAAFAPGIPAILPVVADAVNGGMNGAMNGVMGGTAHPGFNYLF